MNLILEIAQYLDSKGVGTLDEVTNMGDIYLLTMPSGPDNSICIYNRGGVSSDVKLGYDVVSIQIMVRGYNGNTTGMRAQNIYNILHGFHNAKFVSGGFWIVSCSGDNGSSIFLGKDASGRFEFSINFTIEIMNFEGGRNNGC